MKNSIEYKHRNPEGLITAVNDFLVGEAAGKAIKKTLAETKTILGVDAIAAAKIVTAQAESGLSAEVNLGALTSGILKHTVAGGVSTPATASDGTDYLSPITGVQAQTSPGTAQTGGFNVASRGIVGAGQQITGPAIVNSGFVGTVGSESTTVTFSSAADAILAGYNATFPALGTTLIAGGQTQYITAWTNATTCTVDTAPSPAWSETAITSAQGPQIFTATSAGVLSWAILASGVLYQAGNVGIGTTNLGAKLDLWNGSAYLSLASLAHGMTDIRPTVTYGALTNISAAGGLRIDGLSSDGTVDALWLNGVQGAGSASVAAMAFQVGKKDGTSGQVLAATDLAFKFLNYGTNLVSILGNGNVGIGTTGPIFKHDVNGGIYSRLRSGRVMFDDAPVGTQLESTPSAGMVTTAGTNYAAANVTIQAGGVQATTAAADDDSVTILHAIPINTSQNPRVSFRFKVDSVTNAYVAVGLTTAAFADKGALPDNCALIGIDADNGHTFGAERLILTTKDDAAAVDYDDLGSNMANNTWVWGVLDFADPDQPRVWIAGTEIAAASITGTVKDTTAFYLYFHVQNLAAGAHTLTAVCDHWQQDQPA